MTLDLYFKDIYGDDVREELILYSYENIKNFDTDSKKEIFLNTYDYSFLSYNDKKISFGLKIQLSSRAPPIS